MFYLLFLWGGGGVIHQLEGGTGDVSPLNKSIIKTDMQKITARTWNKVYPVHPMNFLL